MFKDFRPKKENIQHFQTKQLFFFFFGGPTKINADHLYSLKIHYKKEEILYAIYAV